MKKDLAIFTHYYPYSGGESFVHKEIIELSKQFNAVYLICSQHKNESQYELPTNVVLLNSHTHNTSKKAVFIKYFSSVCALFIRSIFNKQTLNKYRFYLSDTLSHLQRFENIIEKIKDKNNTIFYSYWFAEWALCLAIAKKKGVVNNFFSRAHLYDIPGAEYFIPFTKFKLEQATKLVFISKNNLAISANKFPNYKNKFIYSPLGTALNNPSINLPNNLEPLHLVSCSYIHSNKRVTLIAEALNNVKRKIHWIHFGGGDELENVLFLCRNFPSNIQFSITGNVAHSEIINHYQNNPVDLFINVSTTEGVPVSIMEAISYGIPILATNVGGNNEIVNEKTGWILPANLNTKILANAIENMDINQLRNIEFRNQIQQFWNTQYNAENNYKNMAEILSN